MAVTLTVGQLAVALRLVVDETDIDAVQQGVLQRLLTVASSQVLKEAPAAPGDVQNEAVIRLAAFLHDSDPSLDRNIRSPLLHSGAGALLSAWKEQRLVSGDAAATAGPVDPGGAGVDQTARDAAAANAAAIAALPAPTAHVDQAARDAAASNARAIAAIPAPTAHVDQVARDAAIGNTLRADEAEAHATRNTEAIAAGGVVGGVAGGRLPSPTVAFRMGWGQTQAAVADIFTRLDNHPADGAAEGYTSGLETPVFPAGLAADPTLYLHLWIAGAAPLVSIRETDSDPDVVVTDTFEAAAALTVGGVDGRQFASKARLTPGAGVGETYDAVLLGAVIATVADVAANTAAIAALAAAPSGGGGSLLGHTTLEGLTKNTFADIGVNLPVQTAGSLYLARVDYLTYPTDYFPALIIFSGDLGAVADTINGVGAGIAYGNSFRATRHFHFRTSGAKLQFRCIEDTGNWDFTVWRLI